MKPSIPHNEAERLRVLRLYHILDVASQKTLHNFTQLAATICETPVSLITIVDKDHGYISASVGTVPNMTPQEVSFCAHAIINKNGLLLVEDATKDERFFNNPAVTSDPPIIFYAGVPLVIGKDIVFGTLCVIDRKPRTLSDYQKETLKLLSDAIVNQFELRRAQDELRVIKQLLPMCAWCRNIRDVDGNWQSLHDYIVESVPVTHSICPDCSRGLTAQQKAAKK